MYVCSLKLHWHNNNLVDPNIQDQAFTWLVNSCCVFTHMYDWLRSYLKIYPNEKTTTYIIGVSHSEPHHVRSTVKIVFLLACLYVCMLVTALHG